jgi:hypothetical protein
VTTPDEREVARKNSDLGWTLFMVAIVLAFGTVAVAMIYNAVASY